jgi:hypothetical protein
MRKLSLRNILDFKRISHRRRRTLIGKLNNPQKAKTESSGHYWITGISAINKAFQQNDNSIITDKILELLSKYESSPHKRTKNMYMRNIVMLRNYENFDFTVLQPCSELKLIPKSHKHSIINI